MGCCPQAEKKAKQKAKELERKAAVAEKKKKTDEEAKVGIVRGRG